MICAHCKWNWKKKVEWKPNFKSEYQEKKGNTRKEGEICVCAFYLEFPEFNPDEEKTMDNFPKQG